ncbi:MAG: TonB-dependent receptor [Acidobacteria bacterium]|nr:TonB-dependent receptor [Acidobacteriota bacterium]
MKKQITLTVLWLCLLSALAVAQEFRATVTGRVLDQNKAAVPNATVTVRNQATNEAVTATTSSEGNYSIPFLRPGIYTITVEAPGFKKFVRDKQELQVSQTATIDVNLEVGATSETVTITAEVALLEETKADRGNVIENRRIVELPLNARNPFMLATLTPGITYNGPAIYQRPFDNGAIADWSINGGLNRSNEFLLDGAPNNSIQGGNNIAYVPPVDAVGEFKIITNSYDAQYGRTAGGVVNVSIKSGGNQFHGSLYEFYRRNWLDSNYLFSNFRNLPAGRFRRADGTLEKAEHFLDQYGGVIEGPVRLPKALFRKLGYDGRDKTFFLFNYEGYREGTPNPQVITVPTEAFRNGDFSQYKNAAGQLITIYDPATGRDVNGAWVRDPFPNNIIPANRINPIAAKLLALYPKPNTVTPGGDPWRNNYADIPNIANDKFKNWIFKIDQNISEKDKVFFRYGYNNRAEIRWTNGITTGPAQDGQLPLNRVNYTGVADWVHTFSGTTVFNVRVSGNRYIEEARFQDGLGYDASQLGFPTGLVSQLPIKMFPRFEISDNVQLGRGSFSREVTNVYSIQPNISMVKGAHSMRFGLDLRLQQYARQAAGNAGLRLTFGRTFTQRTFNSGDALSGSGIADLLLGAPNGGNIDNNVFPIYMAKYYAPWFQDDWKVTRKLTLNLGLRYDANLPGVERYNRLNYDFNTTTVNPSNARIDRTRLINGTQILGGLGFVQDGQAAVKSDYNNIQFRLGFAYNLIEKTVLRGGYGRYFVNPVGAPGYPTNGFSIQTPFVASADSNRTPIANSLNNPFPNGVLRPAGSSLGLETFLGLGFSYSNPDFRVPYVDNYSLGIQRQLPWNIAAEVSYVGSRTYDAQSQFNGINEPTLEFRNRCDATKSGNRNICDELLPNPFRGVAGYSGARFNNASLSRYELMRPFPQFGGITALELNEGKVWYNSMQLLVNKRMSRGLSVSGTYTFSKTIEEAIQQPGQQDNTASYIDDVARIKNRSLAFSDRPHRFTISGVWELPFGKGKQFMGNANRFLDLFVGGWQAAGAYIFNSGRPWQLPGNVDIVDPDYYKVDRKRFVNGAEWIQGVRPCVAQYIRNSDGTLQRNAQGQLATQWVVNPGNTCTAPSFIIREPYTTRVTPIRDFNVRRPSFEQLDINFSKTFRITEKMRFQFRAEAYNLFNTPQYDERAYNTNPQDQEFGSINKNNNRQSNFPRFWQLGFKFLF